VSRTHVIAIGIMMELCYIGVYFVRDPLQDIVAFIVVNSLAFVLLAAALIRSRRVKGGGPERESTVPLIVAFGILFRLTLVAHGPVASDDIYRYLWDGKVAAAGINPFSYPPSDTRLQALKTDTLPERINFPGMRTIYPPLSQGLFYLSTVIFGASIPGLKLLLVMCDIGSVGILIALLRALGLPSEGVLAYAWSPLPVMYFGLDGHVDALGILLLLLSVLLLLKNRRALAAIALGGAALAKLVPLVLAPLTMKRPRNLRDIWLPLISILVFIAGYLVFLEPTGGLIESLSIYGARWEFNGSMFALVYALAESNEVAHAYCAALTLLWIAGVVLMDRPAVEKTFLIFLGMIFFAPVVHPWYLTWIAALLALRWSTAVFVLLGLSNISNLVVYQYRLTVVWQESLPLLLLEYVPFYSLLAWEIIKGEFGRRGAIARWPAGGTVAPERG